MRQGVTEKDFKQGADTNRGTKHKNRSIVRTSSRRGDAEGKEVKQNTCWEKIKGIRKKRKKGMRNLGCGGKRARERRRSVFGRENARRKMPDEKRWWHKGTESSSRKKVKKESEKALELLY